MKKLVLLILLFSSLAKAQTKIKAYFSRPVDTSISSGVNAIWLNQSIDDTLVAYINRAKYSIDLAVFSYDQSPGMANIAAAVNSAYLSGKVIRWIYNGGSSNSGLSGLNSGIKKLASPTTVNYGIMHNKFVVIDANSSDAADPIVWTGSCNWNLEQFYSDENNVVIVQDRSLAMAYQTEFNEMWGSSTSIPNATLSKFGAFKSDNTQHYFNIEGKIVECYFSPSDGTTNHLINLINSADNDLNFGVYTFTRQDLADTIAYKISHGVRTTGIMDQYSLGFNANTTLTPIMGNNLKIYSDPNYIYHSKHLIVDACLPNSDPAVEVGSHNWSTSAETKNDENILIIHDDTIANVFLQAYKASFNRLLGVLAPCTTTDVEELENSFSIYPNPATSVFHLNLNHEKYKSLELLDLYGSLKYFTTDLLTELSVENLSGGNYFIKITYEDRVEIQKFIVIKNVY